MDLVDSPLPSADARRTNGAAVTEGRRVGWIDRRIEQAETGTRNRRWYGGLSAAVGVVALWWLVSAFGGFSHSLLPTPGQVVQAFQQSVTTRSGQPGLLGSHLWQHLGASFRRVLIGLALGIVLGIPLGLSLGLSRVADRVLGPVVDFIKALPPLGYYPLLILWFGITDTSKIWLLFLASFAPIAISTAAGVAGVRNERVAAVLVLGAGRVDMVTKVVLPHVAGDIVTGVRVASGFAWTTIVAAETINGLPGLGGLAWASQKELRADVAILSIIVIGVTAVASDALLRAVERLVAPWKGRA
ncbi:MAG: ABC transporter permease [Propionibacteriaceae bacterium]|jgi:taurine transport system permease protein|nr:ABC transporter permease [Propionibacteriaceae bacterium]